MQKWLMALSFGACLLFSAAPALAQSAYTSPSSSGTSSSPDPCAPYLTLFDQAMANGNYYASQNMITQFDNAQPMILKNDCNSTSLLDYFKQLQNLLNPLGAGDFIGSLLGKIMSSLQSAICASTSNFMRCLPFPGFGGSLNPSFSALQCNPILPSYSTGQNMSLPSTSFFNMSGGVGGGY